MQYSTTGKLFLFFIAVAGWFALIAQLYLNLTSQIASIPELITRYFSYFTILTNLIVAICCTRLLLSNSNSFFTKPKTLTAMTVYIVIVGMIYNVVLRSLWNPQGLQKIVDELLHTIIPVLFLLFWILFVPKGSLQWGNILPWMIYPLVYVVFVLTRGSLSGFYPYPFIDVNKLGFSKTIINSLGITIFFIVLSLIFVLIDKMMRRSNQD